MNITHAVTENIVGDKLEAIFKRQKELMDKYHDIEKRGGLLQTEDCPVNLDDKRGQARIKDFAWRVTEEIGEALDALNVHDDIVHFQEELIDGLHFLTELTILAGVTPKDLQENCSVDEGKDILDGMFEVLTNPVDTAVWSLEARVAVFIEKLGMTCNCLKNKPWKQSNMVTDKKAFKENLSTAWHAYIILLAYNMDADEVADIYLKKSQVNKFRQRSNY